MRLKVGNPASTSPSKCALITLSNDINHQYYRTCCVVLCGADPLVRAGPPGPALVVALPISR